MICLFCTAEPGEGAHEGTVSDPATGRTFAWVGCRACVDRVLSWAATERVTMLHDRIFAPAADPTEVIH